MGLPLLKSAQAMTRVMTPFLSAQSQRLCCLNHCPRPSKYSNLAQLKASDFGLGLAYHRPDSELQPLVDATPDEIRDWYRPKTGRLKKCHVRFFTVLFGKSKLAPVNPKTQKVTYNYVFWVPSSVIPTFYTATNKKWLK